MGPNHHLKLAGGAAFGAISALLAGLPLSFPFPLIPYLHFDLAELPVVVAFLLYGPIAGAISSLTYWLILNFTGSFVPLGPLLKLLAILPMLWGLQLGARLFRQLSGAGVTALVGLMVLFGAMVRVVVTTLANYIVLITAFPGLVEMAASTIARFTGLAAGGWVQALLVVLAFTAVFNTLHTLLALLPAYGLVSTLNLRGISAIVQEPWVVRIARGE
jgi:riboflavin transporter FmnP